MNCRPLAPLVLLFLALGVQGAIPEKVDRLVIGTRTYTNVTVVGINATDLFFTYDKGMSNAKLKYLDPETQKHFNYDPEVASLVEQQQAEDEARWVAEQSAKIAADVAAQAEKAIQAARKAASTFEGSILDPYMDSSFLGKKAPPLEFDKWLEEKPPLEGRFVLIDVWAPWSFACRRIIPGLNDLQKKFAGRVAFVALTSEPEKEIQEMSEPKIAFSSAIDFKGKLSGALGITSIPCVVVIDPKGIVRYQGHPAAINEATLEMLLSKFAEEPSR
jgi:cytochrome c biogenesis protein CcmG/thiol:disulfide interchange protein DsbE